MHVFIEPTVVCLPLSEFGMFNCGCFIYNSFHRIFVASGESVFWIYGVEKQKGWRQQGNFQKGNQPRIKLWAV